jgi:hypothetical protein
MGWHECSFDLLQRARRFATRHEKTLRNYAAVVPPLVGLRVLASFFSQLEHDGGRRARKLVAQMASPAWQPLDELVCEDQEIQRDVVNVEPLVIQDHARYRLPILGRCVLRARARVRRPPDSGTHPDA